jgi:hypothetical protein
MSKKTSDYERAYLKAQKELQDLLETQYMTEKRILLVRKSIETLRDLCESEGIHVEPSEEAESLLEYSTVADEIRNILKAHPAAWLRPHEIKNELVKLGHDLSPYQNPQSTVHMVLKRMVESKEVKEEISAETGKQQYQWIWRYPRLRMAPRGSIANIARNYTPGLGELPDKKE